MDIPLNVDIWNFDNLSFDTLSIPFCEVRKVDHISNPIFEFKLRSMEDYVFAMTKVVDRAVMYAIQEALGGRELSLENVRDNDIVIASPFTPLSYVFQEYNTKTFSSWRRENACGVHDDQDLVLRFNHKQKFELMPVSMSLTFELEPEFSKIVKVDFDTEFLNYMDFNFNVHPLVRKRNLSVLDLIMEE
jgi:hypothetical protein